MMKSYIDPKTFLRELEKKDALESVRQDPDCYVKGLSDFQQSDREVCIATLMAMDFHNRPNSQVKKILSDIFKFMPDFQDHKIPFLRFVDWGHTPSIDKYMRQFRDTICEDRDFVKEIIQRDRFARVFRHLSDPLRSDSELLTLAAESVHETCLGRIVTAIPIKALLQHDHILYRAVENDHTLDFDESKIPVAIWRNKDFVMKWLAKRRPLSIASVPRELNTDRALCVAMYRSQRYEYRYSDIVSWLPKSLFSDKVFILECLSYDPLIFEHCEELHDDIDVLMAAAISSVRAELFEPFIDELESSALALLTPFVCTRIDAHEEFMTFLGCAWRSRLHTISPLCLLDCDEETARGLKATIADLVGFYAIENMPDLKKVRTELIINLVQSEDLTWQESLLPLIPGKVIIQGIIDSTKRNCDVTLQNLPDEIWSQRDFVAWSGMFDKAISDEFAADADICLMYYGVSTYDGVTVALGEQVLPWISDSLKQDPDFVAKCMMADPLIMNYCKDAAIRYDFKVLHAGVGVAVARGKMDDLAEAALDHGWADSLVFYAKALRAKLEDCYAFEAFEFHSRASRYEPELCIKQLIASFLDVPFLEGARDLEYMWSNRSVFALAMGGTVEELCKYRKCLSKRPKLENPLTR